MRHRAKKVNLLFQPISWVLFFIPYETINHHTGEVILQYFLILKDFLLLLKYISTSFVFLIISCTIGLTHRKRSVYIP